MAAWLFSLESACPDFRVALNGKLDLQQRATESCLASLSRRHGPANPERGIDLSFAGKKGNEKRDARAHSHIRTFTAYSHLGRGSVLHGARHAHVRTHCVVGAKFCVPNGA